MRWKVCDILQISWSELKEKQPFAVTLLVNSLHKNRLSHAYIFEGNEGTGKMAVALQLAKTLFCLQLHGIEPCHHCRNCRRIESNNHPDVRIFLFETGNYIKVGQIDSFLKEISYRGSESKRRLFIIEQAHRMTRVAANRLLKFIEEPSNEEMVIFITEQIEQMLPTIASRCQTVSFQPLQTLEFMQKLENSEVPKPLARLVANLTDDYEAAYTLANDEEFAQVQKLVIQLTEEVLDKPFELLLTIYEKANLYLKDKHVIELVLDMLLLWFRDVIYTHLQKPEQIVFVQERERLERYALRFTVQQAAQQMEMMLEAKKQLDANVNPQLVIEQVVLKLQEG